jgi:hypothetical protein
VAKKKLDSCSKALTGRNSVKYGDASRKLKEVNQEIGNIAVG